MIVQNHQASKIIDVYLIEDNVLEIEKVMMALAGRSMETRFVIHTFRSVEAFASEYKSPRSPHVLLLDLDFGQGQGEGLQLCDQICHDKNGAVVVVYSSYDDKITIQGVFKAGADEFISKNAEYVDLSIRLVRAMEFAMLKEPARFYESTLPVESSPKSAVGKTMHTIRQRIPNILSGAISSVFIEGESGVGKEVVVDLFEEILGQTIVRINCGALPGTLVESELFGYAKGAFTGAVTDKKGLFEVADGGWLFLDEVATLSLSTQGVLLRILETGKFCRIGETRERNVSVRILSATNEPLAELVQQGRFRQDLWQRLKEVEISLPPLRERMEELPSLILHFCATMRGGPYIVPLATQAILESYDWRAGNIRELRNCLRAMTEFANDGELTPQSIPNWLLTKFRTTAPSKSNFMKITKHQTWRDIEDQVFVDVVKHLESAEGITSLRALSERLKISRPKLTAALKRLGLLASGRRAAK